MYCKGINNRQKLRDSIPHSNCASHFKDAFFTEMTKIIRQQCESVGEKNFDKHVNVTPALDEDHSDVKKQDFKE